MGAILRKIAPTQKELVYSMLESPSTKNQSNFRTRPSSSLFQITRGSGATPRWMNFFKKHTPLEDPKKRYMVSLKKALEQPLFLLEKRNKMRLLDFNHEVLGGLSMRDPQDTPQGRGKN